MRKRCIAAVALAISALPLAACVPGAGAPARGAGTSTIADTPAPSGPGEKEGQRGNTPPGASRDGQGVMGGAIVDPTGAVTKTPPSK